MEFKSTVHFGNIEAAIKVELSWSLAMILTFLLFINCFIYEIQLSR